MKRTLLPALVSVVCCWTVTVFVLNRRHRANAPPTDTVPNALVEIEAQIKRQEQVLIEMGRKDKEVIPKKIIEKGNANPDQSIIHPLPHSENADYFGLTFIENQYSTI